MTRWKTDAIPRMMSPGPVLFIVAGMVLPLLLFGAGPVAWAPGASPERMVAPVSVEDWPVLENPDGDEIMIVGLPSMRISPQA